MQLPELFPSIIPLVPDETDNLGYASFGESDSPAVGLLIQVPDYFPLQEGEEYLKIFDRKRRFSAQKNDYLRIDETPELGHVLHKRCHVFAVFRIDALEFADDIEPQMIAEIGVVGVGRVESVGDTSIFQSSENLSFGNIQKRSEDVSVLLRNPC